jgi:hypothetical protein
VWIHDIGPIGKLVPRQLPFDNWARRARWADLEGADQLINRTSRLIQWWPDLLRVNVPILVVHPRVRDKCAGDGFYGQRYATTDVICRRNDVTDGLPLRVPIRIGGPPVLAIPAEHVRGGTAD